MADFTNNLALVNGLAERTPGFVWRYIDDSGNSTSTRPYADPRMAINLSVWENVEALERFVYQTVHKRFYSRRAEWFEHLDDAYFVMWWVPAGHRPSVEEAVARLEHFKAARAERSRLRLGGRVGDATAQDGALRAERARRMNSIAHASTGLDGPAEEFHHVLGKQESALLQLQVLVAERRKAAGKEPDRQHSILGQCRRHAPPALIGDLPDHTRHYPAWATVKRDDWCGEHQHREM